MADANTRSAKLAAVVEHERGRRLFVAGMVQRWYFGQRVRVRLRILRLAVALLPALVGREGGRMCIFFVTNDVVCVFICINTPFCFRRLAWTDRG